MRRCSWSAPGAHAGWRGQTRGRGVGGRLWAGSVPIRTRNSVLMRRVPSLSPSERSPHMESISSTKTMEGLFSAAYGAALHEATSVSPSGTAQLARYVPRQHTLLGTTELWGSTRLDAPARTACARASRSRLAVLGCRHRRQPHVSARDEQQWTHSAWEPGRRLHGVRSLTTQRVINQQRTFQKTRGPVLALVTRRADPFRHEVTAAHGVERGVALVAQGRGCRQRGSSL